MDAETVQSLCEYIEHVNHNKLLQLVETDSIEMYSQFQKNINNLFNAYVLMQRPEDQRSLQIQHEKAQKLSQLNTQIGTVMAEVNKYPQRLHE